MDRKEVIEKVLEAVGELLAWGGLFFMVFMMSVIGG